MPEVVGSLSTEWAESVGRGPTVQRYAHEDVDDYMSLVTKPDVVRTALGDGPNLECTGVSDELTFTSVEVGFPMLTRAVLPDDVIAAAVMHVTPPGTRWCEIDMEPGSLLVYGPRTEHTSRSPEGAVFSAALARRDHLTEVADALQLDLVPPGRGEVHQLGATSTKRALAEAITAYRDEARAGGQLRFAQDELVRTLATALSDPGRHRRIGRGRGVDSRRVVNDCVDYARAADHVPSIAELCLTAHVSERRLRAAFVAEFDVPPTQFFRMWALHEARRRLLDGNPRYGSVTDIATGLGFFHLGRFASHYRSQFGESPSDTLRQAI